ncbi:hypothetical protein AB0I02_09180 [Streptomyces phaeochromogenes]
MGDNRIGVPGRIPARVSRSSKSSQQPSADTRVASTTRHTGLARSAYYRWLMDRAERLVYPEEDHPHHGRAQAARLRVALTAGSDTSRAARILAELQEHSPEFVRLWELP